MSSRTQERIVQAAHRLGYQPNTLARSLACQRTSSIGVIIRHFDHPSYGTLVQQIHRNLTRCNYLGIFFSVRNAEEFGHAVDSLLSRHIDGIITVPPSPPEQRQLRRMDVPVIYYGETRRRVLAVSPDYIQGARLAMNRLREGGFRQIAYLGKVSETDERFQAYREFLAEHALPCNPAWITTGEGLYAEGYQQMRQVLAVRPRPDAVFCHNDILAIGAQRAVLEARLRIPEDLALVGFDNIPESAFATVPLTTIDIHLDRVAEHLVELLLTQLNNGPKPAAASPTLIPPTLVIRQSAGTRSACSIN